MPEPERSSEGLKVLSFPMKGAKNARIFSFTVLARWLKVGVYLPPQAPPFSATEYMAIFDRSDAGKASLMDNSHLESAKKKLLKTDEYLLEAVSRGLSI